MRVILSVFSIALLLGACSSEDAPDAGSTVSDTSNASVADAPEAPATREGQAMAVDETSMDPAGDPASDPAGPGSAPPGDEERAGAEAAVDEAIDSNLGDHERYKAVIVALQRAVAAEDAAAVAALVEYPISVQVDGKDRTIKDPAGFIDAYGKFMTPEIRQAIVGTDYKDLFVNYKGVMFGNGQAWINGICKDDRCESFEVKLVTLQSASG